MDARQERGRLLAQAQGGRIKHVEGPMWFVPSHEAGGYLVDVEAETCSCPNYAQHPTKCKHQWAVAFVRSAPTEADRSSVGPETATALQKADPREGFKGPRVGCKGDLTVEEQGHVREALRFLRTCCGGWEPLSKAVRFKTNTLKLAAYGRPPSASLAVRLARFAGVPVDDLLTGRYPPRCPHCGHRMDPGEAGS